MKYLFVFFSIIFLTCPSDASTFQVNEKTRFDHSLFDELLKEHVTKEGDVNYQGFLADQAQLDQYLELLSNNPPNKKTWSEEEQLAYWINAYNAFTVKLILNHYPVKSIKDIKKGIPFVNGVWDIEFFKIGGKEMNLNEIEHGIIREEFEEPRIHFAVNCASFSCPHLRNEAFVAERLDEQLTDQTRVFLADTRKNKIENSDKIYLSKIFQWYSTDFTNKGFFSRLFGGKGRTENLINYIQPFVEESLNKDTEIEFLDYNWNLNEQ